jgi:endonuclease/exonuclease/phosphatase family metal-dependent hydrolase
MGVHRVDRRSKVALRRLVIGGFLGVLVGGALTVPAVQARADTTYIIGQFNMAGGNSQFGTHGDEAPDALVTSVESRGSQLAFVTIQEGCRDWMQRLRDRLPDYDVAFHEITAGTDSHPVRCFHQRDNALGDQVNAVLYRRDFGIDAGPDVWDLGTDRAKEHREMLCVKSLARRIVICSAHLSAANDVEDRRREAGEAARILRAEYGGYTILLGGDLNDDPLSAVSDNFYAPGYEHGAHGDFKEVDSPCGNTVKEGFDGWTLDPFTGLPIPFHTVCRSGEMTHPGTLGFGDEKIDYLFVPLSVTVHDAGPTSARFSDHRPLWATVTVPDTPGGGGGGGGDPVDHPPVVSAGGPVSGSEGAAVTLRGFASDDAAAPSVAWSYRPVSNVDPGTTCTFSPPDRPGTTFTCNDDGVFEVTLTANDGVNPPVSSSTEVTIANVAPTLSLTGPRPWQVFRAGTAVPLAASFTDPGADTHTCTVAWDDGVTDTFPAQGACDRRHTFAHAGMFTITVSVADDDGGTDTAKVMVIVYDPAAGQASGNGWLGPNPGEAGFAFQGSYPGRTDTPQGAVTFSLPPQQQGYLRTNNELQWVVITPDEKIAIKGKAELVPGRRVNFVMYAYRGCTAGATTGCQPDGHRFRITIWPESAGDIPGADIIYDNRPGADYDVDLANPQSLAGGTITILR